VQPKPAQVTPPSAPAQPKPAEATPPGAPAQPKPSEAKPPVAPAPQSPAASRPNGRSEGQRPSQAAPSPTQTPAQAAPAAPAAGSAPPPPQRPRDASQFIRKPGEAPARTIKDVRQERHETREGNTTVIREGDRTIIREGGHTIIRHSEADRFAVGARDVHVDRRGNETVTTIERANGDRIITISDPEGRLIRRVRREPNGREIVIVDESRVSRGDLFVVVPPPRGLPPDRYFVDVDRAPPERIYETLIAPPLEPVERVYSMGQVRYSPGLRMRMPRVDLDINFDTGSWQITPDQFDKLAGIARGLNRAIEHNPREVFLIEGHTDAVGTDEDNLSLSDRRAESIAVALTQEFHVPPENLITQGYGEQELKVPTTGPSRDNRRVAVRRITPLIDKTAAR
jgi:outer membrane protein OmpA-like peptidoglycan-associated protein